MNDRFESLESGEVISVQNDTQVLSGHRTFRVGELSDEIDRLFKMAIADWNEEKKGWFSDRGIECEALRFGSNGWQKGRIRLCLEFCPDQPNPPAQSVGDHSLLATTHTNAEITETASTSLQLPISSDPTTDLHHDRPDSTANPTDLSPAEDLPDLDSSATVATAAPAPEIPTTNTNVDPIENIAIPVAGIAAIGTVAAAAISTPDRHETSNLAQSPLVDTILELEEPHSDPNISHHAGLDEISFDFDSANNHRGVTSTNGMMELDLTDLSLDFPDHDLLTFEANGMSDAAEEFANFQDLGQPGNSGMLIDEVWHEMNQGNWPGIN